MAAQLDIFGNPVQQAPSKTTKKNTAITPKPKQIYVEENNIEPVIEQQETIQIEETNQQEIQLILDTKQSVIETNGVIQEQEDIQHNQINATQQENEETCNENCFELEQNEKLSIDETIVENAPSKIKDSPNLYVETEQQMKVSEKEFEIVSNEAHKLPITENTTLNEIAATKEVEIFIEEKNENIFFDSNTIIEPTIAENQNDNEFNSQLNNENKIIDENAIIDFSLEKIEEKPATKVVIIKKNTTEKRGRKSYKEIEATADLINIPPQEILEKKLYYSIGEVASWFNVNTSQIRFWENEFDILKPRKTKKGDRLFRVEDVKNLELIHHLLRVKKLSIQGAKDYLKANKKNANLQFAVQQSLEKLRGFLLELKANL